MYSIYIMEIKARELLCNVDKSTTNSFLQEGTFIELIDEKKLWALVRSSSAVRNDTSWWDDMNVKWNYLMTGCKPTEKGILRKIIEKIKI